MACKDCVSGTLHDGTPTGRIETIHGLPTYVTDPPDLNGAEPKGVVVIVADAFGWTLPNARVLADRYAERGGWRVLLPDFLDGNALGTTMLDIGNVVGNPAKPMSIRLYAIFQAIPHMIPYYYYNRLSITKPRIFGFFTDLSASTSLPIGAAGFCWGGQFVVLLCSDDNKTVHGKSLITAGFTAHPSAVVMPTDMEAVKIPLCISSGTLDVRFKPADIEVTKGIFAQKEKEYGEGRFEMNAIEGARHGFAVRGDPGDEEENKRGMMAENDAVRFFSKWLQKV